MQAGLGPWDWAVVGAYFALIGSVAIYVSRGQASTRDYFLGGRSLPWWAAALSIIATETSAVTYIGTPRKGYEGDWAFLQLVIGFLIGRLFLAAFFVRVFYRREYLTVYGYLEHAFGDGARVMAAVLFFSGRVVGSAVRLFAGCVAVEAATGLPTGPAIVVLAAFATALTFSGGIRAVVWTDVILGLTFILGGVLSLLFLASQIPDLGGLWSSGALLEKTRIIHLDWSGAGSPLANSQGLVAGLLGGFFLTLATHGTDQDVAQRMLTCKDARAGSLSVAGSAVLILPLMTLFLAVGAGLHFFYASRAVTYPLPESLDHIFPVFIVRELPVGFRGLVMAGLFAVSVSSLTSVLNALSSTAVNDFLMPVLRRLRRQPGEHALLTCSRLLTLFWGLALGALALAFQGSSQSILDIALQVLTYFYGGLLGAFLLAIFTRRGSNGWVSAGMALSAPAVLLLQLRAYLESPAAAPGPVRRLLEAEALRPTMGWVLEQIPLVAWPYWVIVGTMVTMVIGAIGCRRRD